MLIIEIGDDYISIGNETYRGDIYNIHEVFNFIKNSSVLGESEEIIFVLNSGNIFSKESESGNVKKEFEAILPKGHYSFSSEVIEKNRVILYAAPLKLVKLCMEISKSLQKNVMTIDYFDRAMVDYIKKSGEEATILMINMKVESTVFSVIKEGVLKLQTTIKNIGDSELSSSASRIIKYYSDKNSRDHVKSIYLFGEEAEDNNTGKILSEKMSLDVRTISKNQIYYNYEPGQLNFGINANAFSGVKLVYKLATFLSVCVFLIMTIPPLKDYFYAVSQNKEVQGDFDAINDIIWIMDEEKAAKEKLENAKIYSAIIEVLPEDAYNIEVLTQPGKIKIEGNYISEISEQKITEVYAEAIFNTDENEKTFTIYYDIGGLDD